MFKVCSFVRVRKVERSGVLRVSMGGGGFRRSVELVDVGFRVVWIW